MSGGVLSDTEIRIRVEAHHELFVKSNIDDAALRPAAYDVQVATDGLITPKGDEVPPGSNHTRPRKMVLEPGDAALLSTVEEFRLPLDVAGNVGIKNRFATQGLTLLSGMFIDPGYGWTGQTHSGTRLFLHVANVGKQPIEIRPGRDRIATVQFLSVEGEHDSRTKQVPGSKWSDQTLPSLGFLTEMKQLKEQVEKSDTRSGLVIIFGFVVLAVALIGTALTTMLSLAQKAGALRELHRLEEHIVGGLLISAFVLVGLLSFYVCVWIVRRARASP